MLAEATLDIEVARDVHVEAQVRVPDNARGVVALLGGDDALVRACNDCCFGTMAFGTLDADPARVERLAAMFTDAVTATVAHDQHLRDRPIGYFGTGVAGAAVLIAASLHVDRVAAVVAQNVPVELVGAHLSGVRAPTLLLVDPDDAHLIGRTREALPPVPGMSCELQMVADTAPAADWFDKHLRGLMRGQRRELWRQA